VNSPENRRIERPPQAQNRLRGIDFEAVNRAALAALPTVLARLAPARLLGRMLGVGNGEGAR
jgi:hypothetical protein